MDFSIQGLMESSIVQALGQEEDHLPQICNLMALGKIRVKISQIWVNKWR